MALFAAAAVAAFLGIEATGFLAVGIAAALNAAVYLAASIGLNYAIRALSGQEPSQQKVMGVAGALRAGGDVPRAFGVGRHITGGSLVYANYWGSWTDGPAHNSPNAYFTQVIAVSDLPGEQLTGFWIDGQKCTLFTGPPTSSTIFGTSVNEYRGGDPTDHLWVKYYDGRQTAADPFLMSAVSSAERPWGADRIGKGMCYVILTAFVGSGDHDWFSGFPTAKFELSGIPLYDPSRDDTVGGSGSHRYDDPATWGGDGDDLPAVQAYNVLRGIRYDGDWFYGLQNMGPARLPPANWIAQIEKCRAAIDGVSGPEPTYRCGGQINIDAQPANAIDAFLTACQGRLCEIGGFYKIYLGAPDASVLDFTDDDLLSSEDQTFRPFFSLADSINGIQGTYPDPAQGWEIATAPPLYRTDLEARDGNRRLMANPQFNFVPYPAQVQRLQKSGIEEAQRARTHVIPLPAFYWQLEPGDIVTWNSDRNGYVNKLFRVDVVTDCANLDVALNVTEVDPADYDWDHDTDFVEPNIGPTVIPYVPPQGVLDWFAEGVALLDADAVSRRPAIRIAWDPSLAAISGMQYEVRLAADLSHVTRGRTDQYTAGALIIAQGIIPVTNYEVRGQYIPSGPRDMLWSDWLPVTTPDVISESLPASIVTQVTSVMDYLNDRLAEVEQRLATAQSKIAAQDYEEFKSVRSQLNARSGQAEANITELQSVMVSSDTALASQINSVNAKFGPDFSSVDTVSQAVATLNGYAAAQYSITLDVNGYATGFELINGGPGTSATTFVTDKFQIAAPGIGGGAPVPIFTVGNVSGAPKIAFRGDMYADGTIAGDAIVANSIVAGKLNVATLSAITASMGTLTAGKVQSADTKFLMDCDNRRIVISDST
jgi:hypothetical protein